MFQKYKYHILLHFIILLYGFTGILGKLIHQDFITIVWYRLLFALIGLGIVLLYLKKPIKVSSAKQLFSLFGIGIIVALHWITFYKSIQLSTASLGILCLSTTTLHVSWLEPLIMKRKFSWIEFSLGLFVIAGIYFVSNDFKATDYDAVLYGLSSAFLAALFSSLNGLVVQKVPSTTMTFYEILMSLIFVTFILIVQGDFNASLFQLSTSDLLWLLFLGIGCTSFAFLVTIDLIKRLGNFTVSLSINMEPVYTILLAIFILHENKLLGSQFYIGSILIVLVVIANPIIKYFLSQKPT
jgi:drug/metabolite transporter (DMT)-like permease